MRWKCFSGLQRSFPPRHRERGPRGAWSDCVSRLESATGTLKGSPHCLTFSRALCDTSLKKFKWTHKLTASLLLPSARFAFTTPLCRSPSALHRFIVSSSLEMQVKQQTLHQLAALYLKTLRKKKSRTNLADWLVACSCKFSSSLILFFLCLFYPHKVCETHFSFLTHSCPVPPPRTASRSSLPCETLNKNCFYIVSWHFYGSVVIWQQRQGDKSLTTREQLRESRRLNVGFNWLFVFELSSCGLGWSWRWRKMVISLYFPWSIKHLGAEDALILILLITRNRSVRRARWNHLRH